MEAKNPVCRTWFLQLDFSKIKYRSTGGYLQNTKFSRGEKIVQILKSCWLGWNELPDLMASNFANGQKVTYIKHIKSPCPT